MELKKSVKTHGSLSITKALKVIHKFKPKNFCQFKLLVEGVLLSAIAQQAIKKLKGGKKLRKTKIKPKSARLRLRKRKTRRIGGTKDEDDFVDHLIQLYSTIESFHNYHGTCALNAMAVVQGINSEAFEELYLAYVSQVKESCPGFNCEMITKVLTNSNFHWRSDWIYETFQNNLSPVESIIFLKNVLHQICISQSKTELFTVLVYDSIHGQRHAVAVWYTSTRQVILIDIQDGVTNNQFYLYCEDPANNLPESVQKNMGMFILLPLLDYVDNNIKLTLDSTISILETAILKVDQFLGPPNENNTFFKKKLIENYAAAAEFDDPDNLKSKLQVPKVLNYYLKKIHDLFQEENQDYQYIKTMLNNILEDLINSNASSDEINKVRRLDFLFDELFQQLKEPTGQGRKISDRFKEIVTEIDQIILEMFGEETDIYNKFVSIIERNEALNELQFIIRKIKTYQQKVYGKYDDTIPFAVDSVKFKKKAYYYPHLLEEERKKDKAVSAFLEDD
jgi:hypothetical protein